MGELLPFRSPRAIEEEIKTYKRSRFEAYMERYDNGEFRSIPEAIAAFCLEVTGEDNPNDAA